MDILEKCYHDKTMASQAKEMGLYPYFHELQTRQDVEVVMEGKRRIMLGSNNYLGLTVHPEVIEAGVKALEQYGSGCSGSRFLNGTLALHIQLEKELAAFLGKEAVMTFSTGFQTNLGIISAIAGREDYILCDRENHASIYDGCRLSYAQMVRYRHSDMADLEKKLSEIDEKYGKLIVTDGVFSMGGDICKLPEIVALAEKYGARVMVDDAHGLGVLGERGGGTAEHFGLTDKVDIIMGTFSKSLASLGGYMAADAAVIEHTRHCSRPFIFCASIPPANCATALKALEILREHPERVARLREIAGYVRAGMDKRGIEYRCTDLTPIVPLPTGDALKTLTRAKDLYEAGVYVNPVLPPATGPTDCLLRTSYMATHTDALLDEAMDIMKKVIETEEKN
ncbi:MAG TPA: aminotransferase class I/II-fold pyridoxal phosphate-dependent enzyme [Oscillospiraceae bacterium]|nr:aminotransferase class I/II-fold pyridoxal phosphate-dependent enzyme [Oscillospiraceae bacterium]HPK34469.1 aminotransferase class I/II-fold pyridoxal phosphate-dependent enzyme [Oscillospiraceae bacterium]HPR76295.1 aminotransferase class I/II-fold pyridoxal phosphate-dependent enzyme [Oscillospiraceae bacterium]